MIHNFHYFIEKSHVFRYGNANVIHCSMYQSPLPEETFTCALWCTLPCTELDMKARNFLTEGSRNGNALPIKPGTQHMRLMQSISQADSLGASAVT
jgi:hypothetical protein